MHLRSKRSDKPLVRVNCSAVPRDLFESEFFGHVRGAFTGALRDRLGRFQLADGGTLFLDEVSEIPLELQGKLLRAVQEGQFERVGDDRTRSVDVRVVAATNRDLRAEVAAGRFRQDLYFRLSVFPIEIPALRDRAEDIPLLAHHFIGAAARRLGVAPPGLSRAALKFLQGQRFPGNVRELQHSIERAVIAGQGKTLVFETSKSSDWPREPATESDSDNVLTDNQIRSLERRNLELALERSEHRIYGPQGAAELLGLRPTTLVSRLKALGLHRTTPSHRNGGLR